MSEREGYGFDPESEITHENRELAEALEEFTNDWRTPENAENFNILLNQLRTVKDEEQVLKQIRALDNEFANVIDPSEVDEIIEARISSSGSEEDVDDNE